MKKKYTFRILELVVCLLVSLFVVGCHKEKEDVTDEEQIRVVMENAEVVMDNVSKIYEASGTVEEMAQHLDEIRAMPNVEDAYQDGVSICVKIKDGGIIMWSYFLEEEERKTMDIDMLLNGLINSNGVFNSKSSDTICKEKSICVLQAFPENLDKQLKRFDSLNYRIKVIFGEEVTPTFLVDDVPKFGVTLFATHGFYSEWRNNHWLMTGVLYTKQIDSVALERWKNDYFRYVCRSKNESDKHLYVSEDYLDYAYTRYNVSFPQNSIMILDACEAYEANNNFWIKLQKYGLGCLLGFDDSVAASDATRCVQTFLNEMLIYGATASEACDSATRKIILKPNPNFICFPESCRIVLVEHKFSVGQNSYVEFAPGNLADGGRSFVSSQWEYGGYFGWGTGVNPNNHSTDANDYLGQFDDWGKYIPGGWRTMDTVEWDYLRRKRPNADNKWGVGCVNDKKGLILLPDNWLTPEGCHFTPGNFHGWFDYSQHFNYYLSSNLWKKMERAGAVFLPAAGGRIGENAPIFQNQHGFYWTSTPVYRIAIYDDSIATHGPFPRFYGQSVRLVRDRND